MEGPQIGNDEIPSNSVSWTINYGPSASDLEESDQNEDNETTTEDKEISELVNAYSPEHEEPSDAAKEESREAEPEENVILAQVDTPNAQSVVAINQKLAELASSLDQIKNELTLSHTSTSKFESFFERLENYKLKLEEIDRKLEEHNKNKLKELILASSFGAGVALIGTGTAYYSTGRLPQELITVALGSALAVGAVTVGFWARIKKSLKSSNKAETPAPSPAQNSLPAN